MMTIRFKKVNAGAKLPSRQSEEAAGFDLHADLDAKLWPGERRLIPTGFAMQLPSFSVGLIKPRSGLAVKHGIDVMAGVIDSDYRGEVQVLLINHGDASFEIARGDRIAQLVVQGHMSHLEVIEVDTLSKSERGDNGFGSTGK